MPLKKGREETETEANVRKQKQRRTLGTLGKDVMSCYSLNASDFGDVSY